MKKHTTVEIALMVIACVLLTISVAYNSTIKTHKLLQFGFYLVMGISITLKTYRFFPELSKPNFYKCLGSLFLVYASAIGTLLLPGNKFIFLWLLGMFLFSSVEKSLKKEAKII